MDLLNESRVLGSISVEYLISGPSLAFPQFLYKIKNPSEQNLSKPL